MTRRRYVIPTSGRRTEGRRAARTARSTTTPRSRGESSVGRRDSHTPPDDDDDNDNDDDTRRHETTTTDGGAVGGGCPSQPCVVSREAPRHCATRRWHTRARGGEGHRAPQPLDRLGSGAVTRPVTREAMESRTISPRDDTRLWCHRCLSLSLSLPERRKRFFLPPLDDTR